jgi:6-phosphogluconolactonase (cycloisomerase 2 family)
MALSTNTYTYAGGAQTFVVNFALGFIQRSDVRVRVNLAVDGAGDPAYTAFTWIDDSNIVVTPTLTIGDSVRIERTVSKTELKVNFSTTADVTPANLDLSAKHGLMVYQELVDGRIEGAESPIDAANRAAASALTASSAAATAVTSAAAAVAAAAIVDLDQGVKTTDSPTFVAVTAASFVGDGSNLTGVPSSYGDAEVDAHLNYATATPGQFLRYDGGDYDWVDGGSFKYDAVTGTNPALDVGAYNFFDNGTLTADTTVAFTDVPTVARWSYSCVPAVTGGHWDTSTATYTGNKIVVSGVDTTPTDVKFKPDGLKMYMTGAGTDAVNEFDLSTAWDVSTAAIFQSFSVAAQDNNPTALFFKPDGLKMYVIGSQNDLVYEYNLSTAWDVSTATFLQSFYSKAQEPGPEAVVFKPDGTKMYVSGYLSDKVHEYNLSTAWDVSTATLLQDLSIASEDTYSQGMAFKPDGSRMYIGGQASRALLEYVLSTPWDVSTATFSHYTILPEMIGPRGIDFRPDGLKLFAVTETSDTIFEYDLGDLTTVTLPASVTNPPAQPRAVALTRLTYDFFTADGGATVHLISKEEVK